MNKFLGLYMAFAVFLASSVSAIPQDHLAPAVESNHVSNIHYGRNDPKIPLSAAAVKVHGREIGIKPPNPPAFPRAPPLQTAAMQGEKVVESVPAHVPRQVHNADYGSNGGPTGNPKTTQQTSTSSPTSTTTASESKETGDSSEGKKRRTLNPHPTQDINYIAN
ncbi:uncharacterized protein FOMMEDRAFT_168300 [Fomitiporia mediterranea MF3/22]|uniref:uncharacterized protein n=1 Tax=Fomitiporia mediterranea (strain MF3/22) TaxID=694068 RepID=UPI0004407416|nr:uncharacterized protein FOMMEDRAFT_168300 [Fomitiporia mediterranea MF3/22]EJD03295.1 hypothetical protein FOMMEDRAFT_168300 [Fomitiporia mediterranea MF3/22]